MEISDAIIDLYNATRSIANRTIVLHAMRDDGGKGGFPDSNTTGYVSPSSKLCSLHISSLRNAGARMACGVISATMEESKVKSYSPKVATMITDFLQKLFP